MSLTLGIVSSKPVPESNFSSLRELVDDIVVVSLSDWEPSFEARVFKVEGSCEEAGYPTLLEKTNTEWLFVLNDTVAPESLRSKLLEFTNTFLSIWAIPTHITLTQNGKRVNSFMEEPTPRLVRVNNVAPHGGRFGERIRAEGFTGVIPDLLSKSITVDEAIAESEMSYELNPSPEQQKAIGQLRALKDLHQED